MQTPVSVQDKKSFIQWFLNHYQLKKREGVWILNYLVNHDNILSNVHFIREARFCPRAIIISTYCTDKVPFRFYKNHLITTDAEKSFHDIRLNQDEPLYIQLNFNNARQNPSYVAVLEDNPFIPEGYFITEKDQELAKGLLEQSLFEFRKKLLRDKIDQSLDDRNQKTFKTLVNELHKLEETYKNQPMLSE